MAGRWLSNAFKNTDWTSVQCVTGQTRDEALRLYRQWLHGKIIGDPKATEHYSVAELKRMGYVGVYEPED